MRDRMASSSVWLVALLTVAILAAFAVGCGGDDTEEPPPSERRGQTEERQTDETTERGELPSEPHSETVARGLELPWEIVFLPDGDALITERPGRVRLLSSGGELRDEPVARIDVRHVGEGGLLGMALDPGFEENRFVYLYRTTGGGNQVDRYTYRDRELKHEQTIVRGIPSARNHNGGRLHFGPDDRLYVSTGDAGQERRAQNRDSLAGKVLRLDSSAYRDGEEEPEVFTLGHRNVQGFDWQPGSDRLYASEHGARGNDEVNLLRKGRNYGWPEVEGKGHAEFTAPLAVYTPAIAPGGATFVEVDGSAWDGDFLVAGLRGEQIRRLRFDNDEVTLNEAEFDGEFGRVRTVVQGPDRALYALTSNRNGRGSPRDGDDRVIRITPPRD